MIELSVSDLIEKDIVSITNIQTTTYYHHHCYNTNTSTSLYRSTRVLVENK